jgi:hypothetical protein
MKIRLWLDDEKATRAARCRITENTFARNTDSSLGFVFLVARAQVHENIYS